MENPNEPGDWYIVTADHVVWDVKTVTAIHPEGGKVENVKVLGRDEITDVALLDASPNDFPFPNHNSGLTYLAQEGGRVYFSPEILPGTRTLAAGYGIGGSKVISVTGNQIVSELNNNWESQPAYVHVIKTDTSLLPGMSGGPLMTLDGGLIGINTSALEQDGIYFHTAMDEIETSFPKLVKGENIFHRLVEPLSEKYPVRPKGSTGTMYVVITDPWLEYDEWVVKVYTRTGSFGDPEKPYYWDDDDRVKDTGDFDFEEEVYTSILGSTEYQYQFLILSYSYFE